MKRGDIITVSATVAKLKNGKEPTVLIINGLRYVLDPKTEVQR